MVPTALRVTPNLTERAYCLVNYALDLEGYNKFDTELGGPNINHLRERERGNTDSWLGSVQKAVERYLLEDERKGGNSSAIRMDKQVGAYVYDGLLCLLIHFFSTTQARA
jgi:hypothetical protein